VYYLVKPILWILVRLIYTFCGGLRIEGRENVPRSGGVLVLPNHISDADPPTVVYACPRGSYVMAKEELFQMKVVGPVIRWMRGFPVKRYTADRAALRTAENHLKAGRVVIIFPEGQIAEDAVLQPILPGSLLVAQRAGVPIVPTIIIGTDKLVPYAKQTPRPMGQQAVVRFGKPITVEMLTRNGADSLKVAADRFYHLLLALQKGDPYPEFTPTLNANESA
jgi:1-acyl-sn-glycerol-3-phosphate acyltransferase